MEAVGGIVISQVTVTTCQTVALACHQQAKALLCALTNLLPSSSISMVGFNSNNIWYIVVDLVQINVS